MFNAISYACDLCNGSGMMLARDLEAEQACGPYGFRCWCRYGDARVSGAPRWQRSLEKRFKPIVGALIESPKSEAPKPNPEPISQPW